jgi:hypothetical protein
VRRKAQRIEEPINLCRIFPPKHYKKKGNPQRTYLLDSYDDRAERESFSYPGILSTWNTIDSRRSKNTSSTNATGVPFPYICGFTAIFPPTNAKKEKIDQQPNFLSKE